MAKRLPNNSTPARVVVRAPADLAHEAEAAAHAAGIGVSAWWRAAAAHALGWAENRVREMAPTPPLFPTPARPPPKKKRGGRA